MGLFGKRPSLPDPRDFMDVGARNKFDPYAIEQVYGQALGRAPTKFELTQFQKFIENGDLGYQDVFDILRGMPESQSRILQEQTTDLENRLSVNDDRILGRAMSSLESQYRKMGRAGSSGFDSSFARSAQDLAMSRQDALNNFYSSGLTGLRGAYAGLSDSARGRGYDLADARTSYNRNLNLAGLGQAYNAALDSRNMQRQQQMAFGQMLGTAAGAGLGAYAGAGTKLGALGGGVMGGQLGGSFGQNIGLLGAR